jgi:hypothetical protein
MESITIVIILLLILVIIYLWNMYEQEHFKNIDLINTDIMYKSIDYNSSKERSDNLTGNDMNIVNTLKPKRDIICNKNIEIINPNKKMEDMPKNKIINIDNINDNNTGMSMDDLDKNTLMTMDDYDKLSINDNIQNFNKPSNDNNTLSDVEELL